MLGFGRAVGEAIAVAQVIDGSLTRPENIYAPADTMASRLAARRGHRDVAPEGVACMPSGMICSSMSLVTNLVAQVVVRPDPGKARGTDERHRQSLTTARRRGWEAQRSEQVIGSARNSSSASRGAALTMVSWS